MVRRSFSGEQLNHIAFPLGGIGAGMICMDGNGMLSHFSIRNKPDVLNHPCVFSALSVKTSSGVLARVVEGQIPKWKIFGGKAAGCGNLPNESCGLPRFREADFSYEFPFARIDLKDSGIPIEVSVTAWSPFIPNDADNSSLPAVALEFTFKNVSDETVEAVYSFNAKNVVALDQEHEGASVAETANGIVFRQAAGEDKPWDEAAFCARVDAPEAVRDCRWFRGGWFDPLTMLWKNILAQNCVANPPFSDDEEPSPGGAVYVPFKLHPQENRQINLMLSWYVPQSDVRICPLEDNMPEETPNSDRIPLAKKERYEPWYADRFVGIEEVADYFERHYQELRSSSETFSSCFYDSTLPDEVLDAVGANLSILKSPTVLRQKDGRLWVWEGCHDSQGCCSGSCTHVWNYAQAIPHLFPELERSLRETEFFESQDERGHQDFRASLPIGPTEHVFHAAADGQLGGLMKLYREWRTCNDRDWLARMWPRAKKSLDYCIEEWDPNHIGVLVEPHHNTYDIEFWGADGMCGSFYLGALRAATLVGKELGEDVSSYESLLEKGKAYLQTRLFDGEYFVQEVQWTGLRADDPATAPSIDQTNYFPEAEELFQAEGPKYQYGGGCLSDGVLGEWLAQVSGVGGILDPDRVKSHLRAVHRYNLKPNLTEHANPQRPGYALGDEGGLLLCTWPKGGEPSLPFVYSNEVWTGIEYQVASHLMLEGMVEEGLEIVRTCRKRYDGTRRNPFNEYECGHWYGRAQASYALLQGLTGVRYDAVDKTLYVTPSIDGDFRSFICTATGYGTAGIRDGKPFLEVVSGKVEVDRIDEG